MAVRTAATNIAKTAARRFAEPKVPPTVTGRFASPRDGTGAIEETLRRHYFTDEYAQARGAASADAYLAGAEGSGDWTDHVDGRLEVFRQRIIPWLSDATPLQGKRVLEIGAGTGSSTVALAEQGAEVLAVDIEGEHLKAAEDRCRAYGLSAEFMVANATELPQATSGRSFDLLIFFACLEHLTHEERMTAMQGTWEMLAPGALWCVIETPNRLWFFDSHTASMPFFQWLPDDLALRYSRLSPRESLAAAYPAPTEAAMMDFLRRGRGVSYHEFDLTLGPAASLDVVSSLQTYLRSHNLVRAVGPTLTANRRFESFLRAAGPPGLHPGFYHRDLDLIIRR